MNSLESVTNVKAVLAARSGREVSTAVARDIAVCLQQGRQFLQSATASALEIRPLVMFYGTMAYAQALVCAVEQRALSTLDRSHGLKDITSDGSRLSALRVRIDRAGTFQHFNDVVAPRTRFQWYEGSRVKEIFLPTAPASRLRGLDLSLKDILARISDVELEYVNTFREPSCSQRVSVRRDEATSDHWTLEMWRDDEFTDRTQLSVWVKELRVRFPELRKWHIQSAARHFGKSVVVFTNVEPLHDDLAEDILHPGTDGSLGVPAAIFTTGRRVPIVEALSPVSGDHSFHLVSPIYDVYVSEYALQYLAMYLLSSLVRYRPQVWVHAITRSATIQSPADDQALALIEDFMTGHAAKIPRLVERTIVG